MSCLSAILTADVTTAALATTADAQNFWMPRVNGCKGLTISGFEALAVESIRELRDEKDARIAELTDRLTRHKAVLAEMISNN